MLVRDLTVYRTVLRRLSLGDLVSLYERTFREQPALARAISDELDCRLAQSAVAER